MGAQQLILFVGEKAILRRHPPTSTGLSDIVSAAKTIGFHVDTSSSQSLHESLCSFARDCKDETLVEAFTEMLIVPMKPAAYFASGCVKEEYWRHFALNISYYTH